MTPSCTRVCRLGAFCLLLTAASAQAGRPLQTEDAGIIASGGCEVEGARLVSREDEVSSGENGLFLGCGIGRAGQLSLAGMQTRESDATERGLSLGGKTLLWSAEGGDGAALTLAWGVGWAKSAGSGWRHDTTRLTLVGSVPVDGATLHLNLGHARELPTRLVSTTWALAWERDAQPADGVAWAPMAELFGDDRGQAWWNLALRLTLLPGRAFVDASWGRRFDGSPGRLFSAGFKLAF